MRSSKSNPNDSSYQRVPSRAGRSITPNPHADSASISLAGSGGQVRPLIQRAGSGDDRAGAHSSSSKGAHAYKNNNSKSPMASLGSSVLAPTAVKQPLGNGPHSKLHRRGGSGSNVSLPGPLPPSYAGTPLISTPLGTYQDPVTEGNSTPKIKPYLRKMSSHKEDQGKIDLSKSVAENDRLAGLGIQDFNPKSVADVVFAPPSARVAHARTTSVGSQVSNGSGSFKPTQPFVHPMRQAPRPYTPPTSYSHDSWPADEEARESTDVVDDDFRLGHGFRTRRSTSISSAAQVAPTPLSQTISASDLGYVPRFANASQTNLSIKSNKSGKSTKFGRSRGNTGRSQELAATPSSRSSFDKTLSLASRRSDPDAPSRDERIKAARRKFEEKEAEKDRKLQKDAIKKREAEEVKSHRRQERQRRKSEASEKARYPRSSTGGGRRDDSREYSSANSTTKPPQYSANPDGDFLSAQGAFSTPSEKHPRRPDHRKKSTTGGWSSFTSWLKSGMSCGRRRR